jgi:D-apiose dehydrogenase
MTTSDDSKSKTGTLRGTLIGCGFFAVNQMHGWNDVHGADIIAICDTNPARLNLIGDQFNISARYTDARTMLETERPDFVDIATTVPSHRALVELAAELNIPVICQKPFAQNIADAKAMIAACAKANTSLMVHENFRWQSAILKVKQIIASGAIGKPFWGRVSFRSAYDVFSGQPYLADGERFIVEDLGIHALDVARFLLGDVDSVSARITRINPNIKGEDVATMLLDHGAGVTSVIDCSYATRQEVEAFPETLIEIDGNLGSLRLSQGYQLAISTASGTRHQDVSPPLLPWASKPWHNIQESVVLIQQHWVDCLKSKREPDTSGRDNLQTFALVEAVYESARTGKTISIADLLA